MNLKEMPSTYCALTARQLNIADCLHNRALAVALITDDDELRKGRNCGLDSESLEALNDLDEGACLAAHSCHRVGVGLGRV